MHNTPAHVSLLQEKPMREAHKRSRNPNIRKKYRVKNWGQYDRALIKRGDITIWFSMQAITAWSPKKNGKPGRQKKYSDLAIETVLTIRLLFHLPLRGAEGFVHSLLVLMDIEWGSKDMEGICAPRPQS